jgi:hypothetical protein
MSVIEYIFSLLRNGDRDMRDILWGWASGFDLKQMRERLPS